MIFLNGNVPSLKNSKEMGRFPSKPVIRYLRSLNIQQYSVTKRTVKGYRDKKKPNLFLKYVGDYFKNPKYPLVVATHFVRDTKRRFDIINAQQILFDLLSAHHLIEDDNSNYIIPMSFKINGKWFSIDKEKPGVWLTLVDPNSILDVTMKTLQEHK
jgi:hypothetical protein